MQQYYFLFALAFIWTLVATIQDLKKREVANWLNFSLIAFALAYRAFYAIHFSSLQFFLLGLFGLIIFVALGYLFYYGKAFAGGDAKLLMGFGIILPYQSYSDLFFLSSVFIIALFLVGAIYSLIYSVFIVASNKKQFNKEFKKRFSKNKTLPIVSLIAFIVLIALSSKFSLAFFFSILFLIPLLWLYSKSLDACMVKLYPPEKLSEGDWLEKSVRVKNKFIKKSVHGLSIEEIKFLRKHNKKVLIKEGIPFVPAFLITLIIMVFFYLVLHWLPASLFS